MRVPLPERFKASHVVIFASALFLVQMIEGTDIVFAALAFLYILCYATAFNLAGGLSYPSGAYIFFNGLLGCIVGMVYKAMLGDPSEKNLVHPVETMLCYCAGMVAMGFVAFLVAHLRPREGLLAGIGGGSGMKKAAIGCLIVGIAVQFTTEAGLNTEGSFASAIRQLNRFLIMSIILATTYQIRSSGGKSSTNWIVWTAGLYNFGIGLIGFSKEGMFTAPLAWIMPTLSLGFNFSKKQFFGLCVGALLINSYLVPYSQYGRRYRDEVGNRTTAALAAVPLLLDLPGTRRLYLEELASEQDRGAPQYFSGHEGLMEREQMLAYDDAIITYTDEGNVFGLSPVWISFGNAVPHFLWPNKPQIASGNEFGRELGVIDADDLTTGISFSPTGDAYHEAKWWGIALVLPAVIFVLFFITDSLTGSIRRSPWGLLPISFFAHVAPEGLMQGAIYAATYGTMTLILVAVLAKYALPVFSNLLMGSELTRVKRTINFTPLPGRRRGLQPASVLPVASKADSP